MACDRVAESDECARRGVRGGEAPRISKTRRVPYGGGDASSGIGCKDSTSGRSTRPRSSKSSRSISTIASTSSSPAAHRRKRPARPHSRISTHPSTFAKAPADKASWRAGSPQIVERPRLTLPPPGAPARGRWFAARWQDLRYAVRALRRAPTFSAAVIVTLGLTIGPTTALLSIGNWLLWRPAPGVTAPDRLGLLAFLEPTKQFDIVRPLSYLNLDDVRDASRTLAAITGVRETRGNIATGTVPAREVRIAFVRPDFFDAVGVRLMAGRAFRPDEDAPPYGAEIAVISHRLARQLLAASRPRSTSACSPTAGPSASSASRPRTSRAPTR